MKANLKAFSTEHVPQDIVVTSVNPEGATCSITNSTSVLSQY